MLKNCKTAHDKHNTDTSQEHNILFLPLIGLSSYIATQTLNLSMCEWVCSSITLLFKLYEKNGMNDTGMVDDTCILQIQREGHRG